MMHVRRTRMRDTRLYAATRDTKRKEKKSAASSLAVVGETGNAASLNTATWLYVVPLALPREGNTVAHSFEVQPVERAATTRNGEMVTAAMTNQNSKRKESNLHSMAAQQRTRVPFYYVPAYDGALLEASARNAEMQRINNWETRNSAMDTTYLMAGVAAIFATILAINLLFGLLLPTLVKAGITFLCQALSNNKLALAISRALAWQVYFAL